MDDISFRTFPNSRNEAITMLYLQNQNLEGKTPEELAALYAETFTEVQNAFYEISKNAPVIIR